MAICPFGYRRDAHARRGGRVRHTVFHRVAVAGWMALAVAAAPLPLRASPGDGWLGAWSAAMLRAPIPASRLTAVPQPAPPIAHQTVRLLARITAGGDRVRIRLSNQFGTAPIRIDAASLGVQGPGGGADVLPDRLQPLRFGDRAVVTLAPGQVLASDALALPVRAGDVLAVSLYVAGQVAPGTFHTDSRRDTYLSTPGDHTLEASMPVAFAAADAPWLEGIEVQGSTVPAAIVALGDSITNGYQPGPRVPVRYPDLLAERLRAVGCSRAVLDEGIDGNHVTGYLGDFGFGRPMVERAPTDVLAQPGARYLLLLGGINDIGQPTMAARAYGEPVPDPQALATHVIGGLQAIADRAHAAGLKVIGATLLPFEGTVAAYSPAGERARQRVNRWIRRGGAFDAVVDFDAALRDPAHPRRMLPRYDSGDHIHPGSAGYRAMADAVPPALFGCVAPGAR
jgi:lysophospholipase L1-like esterase